MTPTTNTVYVVTGGNRGIGLGLVKSLLARPRTTVVATVRSQPTASQLEGELASSATGEGSEHYIAQLDYAKDLTPQVVRERFDAAVQGKVDHIDVLVCNAGYFTTMSPVLETTGDELRSHFDINTLGPLATVQGLWPLMQKSAQPKFLLISSSVGSIGMMEPMPGGAYGPSKAAANWIAKALHQQVPQLVSVAVHPGFVQTGMGNAASEQWGLAAGPPDTVEDSVAGLLKVMDEATRETTSGTFITQTGVALGW